MDMEKTMSPEEIETYFKGVAETMSSRTTQVCISSKPDLRANRMKFVEERKPMIRLCKGKYGLEHGMDVVKVRETLLNYPDCLNCFVHRLLETAVPLADCGHTRDVLKKELYVKLHEKIDVMELEFIVA